MCGKYCVNQKQKTELEFTNIKQNQISNEKRHQYHQYNQCINKTYHFFFCEIRTKEQ